MPLISTGIQYALSTGPQTFTAEDLADAVACQDDPAIVSPRLKLSLGGEHGPMINEPAFGRAANLRLGDNDQTIYCDFVGVPSWLAEVMAVAYPSRSIEGEMAVETVTGKQWRLVITAVELLGVTWPGISVLPDLPLYYGDEMPANVEVAASLSMLRPEAMLEEERASSEHVNAAAAGEIAASVNADDVRRAYYDSLNSDQLWWWIRAIYLDPNELIVDDDDGTLYRVPFTISGDSTTFADPVEVKIEYVDVPKNKQAASVAVAGMTALRGEEHTRAVFATKAESRPDKEETVDAKALRVSLGLAEDASDDEVKAKFTAAMGEPDPADPDEPDEPTTPTDAVTKPTDEVTEPVTQPVEEPVVATSDKVVPIDKKRLEALENDAKLGVTARRAQVEGEADRLVTAAVEEGRIAPASRKDWRAAILPEGKTELVKAEVDTLASLAAGRIPVDERGQALGDEAIAASGDDYWFPQFSNPNPREAVTNG